MRDRKLTIVLVLIVALLAVSTALADDDATYEDLVEMYGDWTRADVEAAGYVVEPFCVNAEAAGAPAELGAMGFHALNAELAGDGEVHTSMPEVILLDGDDNVIGVEYEIDEVVDDPPTVAGMPLEFTPPHPGMEHEHMSRHVYFVGTEANRFSTFNPAVTCPEGSLPPAEPATMPTTGGVADYTTLIAGLVAVLGGVGVLMGLGLRRRSART